MTFCVARGVFSAVTTAVWEKKEWRLRGAVSRRSLTPAVPLLFVLIVTEFTCISISQRRAAQSALSRHR